MCNVCQCVPVSMCHVCQCVTCVPVSRVSLCQCVMLNIHVLITSPCDSPKLGYIVYEGLSIMTTNYLAELGKIVRCTANVTHL